MRRHVNHLKQSLFVVHPINHPILETQTRRAMTLPVSTEGLIVESLDQSQSRWAGDPCDVFPLLVSLQDLARGSAEFLV
jgi:hypothetical protein